MRSVTWHLIYSYGQPMLNKDNTLDSWFNGPWISDLADAHLVEVPVSDVISTFMSQFVNFYKPWCNGLQT